MLTGGTPDTLVNLDVNSFWVTGSTSSQLSPKSLKLLYRVAQGLQGKGSRFTFLFLSDHPGSDMMTSGGRGQLGAHSDVWPVQVSSPVIPAFRPLLGSAHLPSRAAFQSLPQHRDGWGVVLRMAHLPEIQLETISITFLVFPVLLDRYSFQSFFPYQFEFDSFGGF